MYGPSHVLGAQTVEAFLAAVSAYHERFGSFVLETHRTGLIVEGKPFEGGESVDNLALLLYTVGVWQLVFLPEITETEVAELLEIVSLDRDAILAEGGFIEILTKRSVRHIRVFELKPGEEEAVVLTAELYQQLLDGSLQPQDRAALLATLRAGSEQTRRLLTAIVELTVRAFPGASGQELGTRVYAALAALDRIIVDTPRAESQVLMQELATAVAELDDPRRVNLHKAILARSADDLSARALLSAMTSEQIARVVIPCLEAGEPPPQITQMAQGLAFDPEKVRETIALISQQLGGRSFDIPPSLQELVLPPWVRNIEHDLADFQIAEAELMVSDAEIQTAVAEAHVEDATLIREHALTLTHLCTDEGDSRELDANFDALVQSTEILLDQAAYDVVAVILRNLNTLKGQPGRHSELSLAAFRKVLTKITGMLTVRDISRAENEHPLVTCLREAEGSVVPLLAEALTTEKDPGRLRVIRALLTKLGENYVDALSPYLQDPRPYVVREILNILAAMRSPLAITSLAALARHPEASVRTETLDALGAIPTAEAQGVLRGFLSDPNLQLRAHALTHLRPETVRQVAGELVAMLQARELSRYLPVKIQIVETLARVGAVEALPGLRRLASPFKLRKRDREFALHARAAVAALSRTPSAASHLGGGALR